MWKEKLINFAKRFEHTAWGMSHFTRVYELTLKLADMRKLEIDQESLFAAAYLHDMGAFDPYRKKDIDHAEASANSCEEVLKSLGFPPEKIDKVKDIIRTHMYYAEPSGQIESVLFRDADILDFMGIIGIIRILSIVGKDTWAPNLNSAINLIRNFDKTLIHKLSSDQAKEIGVKRRGEMKAFLENLSEQTNKFKLL